MDSRAHQELLRRLAVNLAVQHEEVHEDLDPMVDIIAAAGPGRVALPLNKTVDKLSKTLWQTPASIAPTQKGVERRYYVPQEGHEYLFTHPAPGSIVVQAAGQKERQGPPGPTPKAKEPRRFDLLGRKAYATGGLQLSIANQQLMMGRYAFNMWASTQKFASQLPPESRQEFEALTEEGQAVARTSLQAALDAADSAARTMATGVVMRRSAWQVSGIPLEVQTTIQDLPFEGPALFSEQTDSKLHSLKDSRTTLKSLGIHTPAPQRRSFQARPYPRRGQNNERGHRRGCNNRRPDLFRGRRRGPQSDSERSSGLSPGPQAKPSF
nr:uncharacterized protein LOC106731994 [Pelodiscus sinensis]|eukprot:XP_014428926.1 uncharacterized protein LOC106731994 [Pelodiscus sinensis]